MRRRFRAAEEAETINRVAALEAISFYFGEQWANEIERARLQDGRPCFTLNKLPAIVRQVLNEERANPPAIEIEPAGEGAEDEDAEAVQGLARHVETHSDAKLAYENAFQYLVIGGFGSWRVDHNYLPRSMDQECFIEPIWNPFSVYWDPASQKPDKSDARFCFVTIDLSVEEHNDQYPDSELAGRADFDGLGDLAPGWVHRDGARVVEYFYIETEDATLVQLTDGRCVYDDDIPKGAKIAKRDGKPVTRKDTRRRCYVAHSNGLEWLKKAEELPTEDIPIVTVYGERLQVGSEVRYKGMVGDLEEAQRMFNYNSSAITETMALGAKSNWLATVEQIEQFMDIWRQSNSRNLAVLPYKNMPGVAPPQKIATEPPIQAMSLARQQSADDLRAISGVYDPTQSPRGGEESGRAIITRRRQASVSNNHWTVNLARGVKRTADILIKYFPVIYDNARVLRITGKDQQTKRIMVHAGRPDTLPPVPPPDLKGVFDLSVGRYAITVGVGPSYETMREETLDMLLALVAADPTMAPLVRDLVVNEMAFPNKQAFVARLQRALPPNLQDPKEATDPNQLQAQNGMLMQQNQSLMQRLAQLQQMIQTHAVQNASRERVEQMKLEAAKILAESRLEQEQVKQRAHILTKAADAQTQIVHDHAMADKDAVHEMMHREHAARIAPPAPLRLTQ